MKEPLQHRSRASFERMLEAAEALMIERGSDDFTLTEVSKIGRVSIGSIYNRFASKDELIQALGNRILSRIEVEQAKIVMRARSQGGCAADLVRALISELGEFLSANGRVMRPLMLRAAFDKILQDRGKVAHDKMVENLVEELLSYKAEIRHPDPERAIRSSIRIAYAAFARELNFGMTEAPQGGMDWETLKEDMAAMAAAFLLHEIAPDG